MCFHCPTLAITPWGTFGNLLYSCASIPIPEEFKPAPTLILNVEVEGGGADNPACAGCVSADEAKKFYNPGDPVRVTAHPYCGYAFKSWSGENEMVWLDEDDVG